MKAEAKNVLAFKIICQELSFSTYFILFLQNDFLL